VHRDSQECQNWCRQQKLHKERRQKISAALGAGDGPPSAKSVLIQQQSGDASAASAVDVLGDDVTGVDSFEDVSLGEEGPGRGNEGADVEQGQVHDLGACSGCPECPLQMLQVSHLHSCSLCTAWLATEPFSS
jgi:hypothetical protein